MKIEDRMAKYLVEGFGAAATYAKKVASAVAPVAGGAALGALAAKKIGSLKKKEQIEDLKKQNVELHAQMAGKDEAGKESIRNHIKRNVERMAQLRRS